MGDDSSAGKTTPQQARGRLLGGVKGEATMLAVALTQPEGWRESVTERPQSSELSGVSQEAAETDGVER